MSILTQLGKVVTSAGASGWVSRRATSMSRHGQCFWRCLLVILGDPTSCSSHLLINPQVKENGSSCHSAATCSLLLTTPPRTRGSEVRSAVPRSCQQASKQVWLWMTRYVFEVYLLQRNPITINLRGRHFGTSTILTRGYLVHQNSHARGRPWLALTHSKDSMQQDLFLCLSSKQHGNPARPSNSAHDDWRIGCLHSWINHHSMSYCI